MIWKMELKVHISNPLKDIFSYCNCDANLLCVSELSTDNKTHRIYYVHTLAHHENLCMSTFNRMGVYTSQILRVAAASCITP